MRFRASLLFATTTLLTYGAHAQVSLPHVFSDHAVLQRDKPLHIWGWSAPSEKITVRFHEQTNLTTAAQDGTWELYLRPESAGGPYTLTVSGSANARAVTVSDLLVGDLWLASGQSNMEFPMKGFNATTQLKDAAKEIAAANHPNIRILIQHRTAALIPQYDQPSSWAVCTPDSVRDFSAVAYFFAREISDREHVPIGVIDSTWGGTPAQSWISAEGVAYANLTSVYNDGAGVVREQGRSRMLLDHYADLTKQGVQGLPKSLRTDHGNAWIPSTLYNGMIAPYTPLSIKGVIWYQGEGDYFPNRQPYYARVFPALIQDWRRQFAQGDFPFLFVQISTFKIEYGEVRDNQRRSLDLRNTGMAVTVDVGLKDNVHPPDKQTVGHRLALSALGIAYNESIRGTSPLPEQFTTEGSAYRVWLSHAEGLKAGDSGMGDFEVADDKGVFHPAEAKIETIGNVTTVLVESSEVKSPTAVRYGWAPYVGHYLYNDAGLPLATFSSERLPAGSL